MVSVMTDEVGSDSIHTFEASVRVEDLYVLEMYDGHGGRSGDIVHRKRTEVSEN